MMQVKRYVAASFAEALIQAKNELGSDAMIVETKKVRVGGLFGLFGREVTEITVAADQTSQKKPAPTATVAPLAPGGLANVERELASLRSAMGMLLDRSRQSDGPPLQGYAREVYELLLERGVADETALEIGQRVEGGRPDGHAALREEVARLLGPCTPIVARKGQRKVIALVGPTGVGKTTTLAKLAAQFTLHKGLTVGMITCDTYRIAAIQQLRTYAEILGLPVHAVDTPAEVAAALQATAQCDLVLVDTAGRSHRDPKRMQELRDLLAMIRPDETHLVTSLTASQRDVLEIVDTYAPLGVNRLTFTKLDEATSPGVVLNVRSRHSQPLAYVTHGQSVPEDIIPADPLTLTNVLLGV